MQRSAIDMSFIQGSVEYVQLEYPDYHGAGYPGQLFKYSDAWNNMLESFPVDASTDILEQFVFCGRLVVQAVVQNNLDSTNPSRAPFSVRAPISTDTDVTKYAGIIERSFAGNVNSTAEGSQRKAGFPEKTIAPLVPFGKGIVVLVHQSPGLSVVYGDDVFVALDSITGPPVLNPGEFTNAAGANLVQVPNAIWYTSKDATTIDQIGSIQFN